MDFWTGGPVAVRVHRVSARKHDIVDVAGALADKGGTIEMGRVQVSPSQWKTSLINIQISGRLVFFKTIAKQQYETRSDFQLVSSDLSAEEASRLLAR